MGLFGSIFKLALVLFLVAASVWLLQNTRVDLNLDTYVSGLIQLLPIPLFIVLAFAIFYLLVEYRNHVLALLGSIYSWASSSQAAMVNAYLQLQAEASYIQESRIALFRLRFAFLIIFILLIILLALCLSLILNLGGG